MVYKEEILKDKSIELWANSDIESNELLSISDNAIYNKKNIISISNNFTSIVWSWLEDKNIKIYSRIYLSEYNDNLPNISEDISNILKKGASGIQLIMDINDKDKIIEYKNIFNDNLFIKKDLSIGININHTNVLYWYDTFKFLKDINSSSFLIICNDENDIFLIGKIYNLLKSWDFYGELHIKINSLEIKESILRLIEKLQPKIKYKFFI